MEKFRTEILREGTEFHNIQFTREAIESLRDMPVKILLTDLSFIVV